MGIASLFHRRYVPSDFGHRFAKRPPVQIDVSAPSEVMVASWRLFAKDDPPCVRHDGGCIAGDEGLPISKPDDDTASVARRAAIGDPGNPGSSPPPRWEAAPLSRCKVLRTTASKIACATVMVMVMDEMDDHFRVCITAKAISVSL